MERTQTRGRASVRQGVGRFVALAAFLACSACSTAPRRAWTEADYPGELRAVESFRVQGLWRQRVTAFWGESEKRGFDAALQRKNDTLTVLGLSPMGSMGFAFQLRAGSIEVTNNTEDELPIPPRFILLDVQRAFYPWLPASDAFGIDGRYEGEIDGEHVVEIRKDGKLHERIFRRLDEDPEGEIRVRYTWARDDWSVPSVVELENDWFGYRLRVETHEETLLPEATP